MECIQLIELCDVQPVEQSHVKFGIETAYYEM